MKRLTDNINSSYFEAANSLRSKKDRHRIVAYVESYDDVLFWRSLLSAYEDDKRYFEVMLPSRSSLERGKRSALMSLMDHQLGQGMIACVDADYDFLMQGVTPVSQFIIDNPFVLHTYAYAIENMQCYAPSLHDVCVMVTLNDHAVFDFRSYLGEFSKIIFPLFVWSIWHYRNNVYGQFTITDFNKSVELGKFSLANATSLLDNLRAKVFRKCNWLKHRNPNAKESYLKLKKELMVLGVTPETTYLYIQGHHLFDKLVQPMLAHVCQTLVRERENEIRRKAVHSTQMRNELSCYAHSVQDVEQMLKKNMGYMGSEPFRRIQHDLEAMLNMTPAQKPEAERHDE